MEWFTPFRCLQDPCVEAPERTRTESDLQKETNLPRIHRISAYHFWGRHEAHETQFKLATESRCDRWFKRNSGHQSAVADGPAVNLMVRPLQ